MIRPTFVNMTLTVATASISVKTVLINVQGFKNPDLPTPVTNITSVLANSTLIKASFQNTIIDGFIASSIPSLVVNATLDNFDAGVLSTVIFNVTLNNQTYNFTTGDIITINMPLPGSFTPAGRLLQAVPAASVCKSLTLGITVSDCAFRVNQVNLTLAVDSTTSSFGLRSIQVTVPNFKNPTTTAPIVGINGSLSN